MAGGIYFFARTPATGGMEPPDACLNERNGFSGTHNWLALRLRGPRIRSGPVGLHSVAADGAAAMVAVGRRCAGHGAADPGNDFIVLRYPCGPGRILLYRHSELVAARSDRFDPAGWPVRHLPASANLPAAPAITGSRETLLSHWRQWIRPDSHRGHPGQKALQQPLVLKGTGILPGRTEEHLRLGADP